MITRLGSVVSRRASRWILAAFALLTMTGMVFGFALPDAALAWNNCPKGLTNDPYPGVCRRYVDTNGDNICDLSQSKPVASTTTTLPVTTTETSTTSTTKVTAATGSLTTTSAASGEPPTGNCPLGPCIGCRACISISIDLEEGATIAGTGTALVALANSSSDDDGSGGDTTGGGTGGIAGDDTGSDSLWNRVSLSGLMGTAVADAAAAASSVTASSVTASSATAGVATAAVAQTAIDTQGGASLVTHYLVGPIAIGFFLIYGLSFLLYKTKKIRITTHRKIWNVMLLGTFLVTGIFGLILTIELDYTLPFTIPINLLFWHVEAGIAMTLISLFHMGWHFNYYKNLVKNTRKKARAVREAERDERNADRDVRRRERAVTAPHRELLPDNVVVIRPEVAAAASARPEVATRTDAATLAREERRVEREARRTREEVDRWKQSRAQVQPRPWLGPETD